MENRGLGGKVPGLPGPSLVERALFPFRLVLRPKSKNIPYNCLNSKIVSELNSLRWSWTAFKFREKGALKKEEFQVMMKVYGSSWLKEYWLPFPFVCASMPILMIAATVAFGSIGTLVSALGTMGAYCWWVNSTMNVVRPGEIETMLPYLRLDGADRAYLEAIDALSKGALDYEHSLHVLAVLNSLLEQDFQLQTELGAKPSSAARDQHFDETFLRTRLLETAGTPLEDVYLETLRLAEARSNNRQNAQLREEFLAASRRLVLEKLWALRDGLARLSATDPSIPPAELVLQEPSFDSKNLIRALEEIQSVQEH